MMKNYETVFILTPVLSEVQMKDAVEKFKKVLQDSVGAEIIHEENWGLRKLAYPIQHKSNGFYYLIEFKADSDKVNTLEIEYRRDEKIIRFLTTVLDKYAIDYNERRRKGLVGRKKDETKKEVVTEDKEN
jgi:small subunit ribosomal protein S6